jgi:hypothetical protein
MNRLPSATGAWREASLDGKIAARCCVGLEVQVMTVRGLPLLAASRAHLAQVREGYYEHLHFAIAVGGMLAAAGLACCLHALLPAVCRHTASRTIRRLHRLLDDRSALEEAMAESGEAIGFTCLFTLSVAVAGLFWLLGAAPAAGVPITLLALSLPVAALAANPDLDPLPPPDPASDPSGR